MPVSENLIDQIIRVMGADVRYLDTENLNYWRAYCDELVDVPPDSTESDKAES